MGGSNVFSMFSQKQVAEFKEGFQLMDRDKDGILSKNDLRATFDELGRIAPEKELDEMIAAAPGPIDGESLRHALMTWGDKFSSKEVDDAFESMVIDSENKIDTQKLIEMLTAAPAEEEAEAA